MQWDRIEAMARSTEFDEGVQARIADALWMLGRQWQLGELTGDDAAQPAAVRLRAESTPLVSYRAAGDPVARAIPRDVPLERLVEEMPPPADGLGGLNARARAGVRLTHRLRRAGLGAGADALQQEFGFGAATPGAAVSGHDATVAALVRRRAVDAAAVLAAPDDVAEALSVLAGDDRVRAAAIVNAWRGQHLTGPAAAAGAAWRPARLEHDFSVAAPTADGEVVLRAAEHPGGDLDWHSFDVDPAAKHGLAPREPRRHTTTTIPTPVRYHGMPASRWWEFEDGMVNLGDPDAGPADLARLSVAEFASLYSDDWFSVPLRLPAGALARVLTVDVIDTFGGRHRIDPVATVDRPAAGRRRAWRLFELRGDRSPDDGRAPWLFLPPVSVTTMNGPPVERVTFVRDEAANLAWAIERLVEGPLGRAVDRAAVPRPAAAPAHPPGGAAGDQTPWRYRLESPTPPWWIPFVPQRVDPASAEVRLRRARMSTWSDDDPDEVGPKGELLERGRPFSVHEEEVPVSGVVVERLWQWTRGTDGTGHLWLQRRKRIGRGERSSGLRWDLMERDEDERRARGRA